MTVATFRAILTQFLPTLPIYASCCGIQRLDAGIGYLRIVAPLQPGEPQTTRYTVGSLLSATVACEPSAIVLRNEYPITRLALDEDDTGQFADLLTL